MWTGPYSTSALEHLHLPHEQSCERCEKRGQKWNNKGLFGENLMRVQASFDCAEVQVAMRDRWEEGIWSVTTTSAVLIQRRN